MASSDRHSRQSRRPGNLFHVKAWAEQRPRRSRLESADRSDFDVILCVGPTAGNRHIETRYIPTAAYSVISTRPALYRPGRTGPGARRGDERSRIRSVIARNVAHGDLRSGSRHVLFSRYDDPDNPGSFPGLFDSRWSRCSQPTGRRSRRRTRRSRRTASRSSSPARSAMCGKAAAQKSSSPSRICFSWRT